MPAGTTRIRRATERDVEAITELYLELRDHHRMLQPHNPRYAVDGARWRQLARRALNSESDALFVAERDEEVAGFVRLAFEDKPWGTSCEVEALVVTAAHRGGGCGTELMRVAEDHARARGAKGLRVDVLLHNEGARRFYEDLGYAAFAVRLGKPTASGR